MLFGAIFGGWTYKDLSRQRNASPRYIFDMDGERVVSPFESSVLKDLADIEEKLEREVRLLDALGRTQAERHSVSANTFQRLGISHVMCATSSLASSTAMRR